MIEDILLDSPRFKKYKISMLHLQSQIIRTAPGQLPKGAPKTRAVHAVCAATEKNKVRKILKMVYPSTPAKDYPQGIQLRAIENTADPDFPVPRRARAIAARMRTKQQNFSKIICVTHYDHFKNVHSSIEHPKNPILSQLLYNWRSTDDPTQRLFLMVEQDYEDFPTKFSYLASVQDEVSAILPVLPLILVGRLGPAANAWFLPTHTLGTDGYRYDTAADRIVPIDSSSNLETIDRLWDQSDEGFTDHADLAEDDDDSYNGMVIEFGEFFIAMESRSRILGDDSASLATLNIPSQQDNESSDDDNSDMDTTEDDQRGTPGSVAETSSLTTDSNPPPHTIKDSIAHLLANTTLDPTIRQAILHSQQAAEKAREES